jgi:hypothetical protein
MIVSVRVIRCYDKKHAGKESIIHDYIYYFSVVIIFRYILASFLGTPFWKKHCTKLIVDGSQTNTSNQSKKVSKECISPRRQSYRSMSTCD